MSGDIDAVIAGLADRCEAATGPDREIDTGIAAALGWRKHPNPTSAGGLIDMWFNPNGDTQRWSMPAFTGSLDAAISLVPEHALWTARTVWDNGKTAGLGFVSRYERDQKRLYWMAEHQGLAATPALALCAAALRARLQEPRA